MNKGSFGSKPGFWESSEIYLGEGFEFGRRMK
jgi:hypothetical protein